jgi:hypothetical protein
MHARRLAELFKTLVRFHYAEWDYNEHWGGDRLSTLLRKSNPILRTKSVAAAEADESSGFDFDLFIDALTDPGYPKSPKRGVYLYYGFDKEAGRGAYPTPLKEEQSHELKTLAAALPRTNYYALEQKWRKRLQREASKIAMNARAGMQLFLARIGFADEAWKTKLKSSIDEAPVHVTFPYVGRDIAAPPQIHARAGRLNRANVSFLYLADTLDTALAEVRPHPGHTVSIGQFQSTEDLRFANLAGVDLLRFAKNEEEVETFVLLRNMEQAFALPVVPDDPAGYLLTQFLADILRQILGGHPKPASHGHLKTGQ